MLTSENLDQDDPKVKMLVENIDKAARLITFSNPVFILFPSLTKLFPHVSGFLNVKAVADNLAAMIREIIEDHVATLDGNHSRDFIDVYLKVRILQSWAFVILWFWRAVQKVTFR